MDSETASKVQIWACVVINVILFTKKSKQTRVPYSISIVLVRLHCISIHCMQLLVRSALWIVLETKQQWTPLSFRNTTWAHSSLSHPRIAIGVSIPCICIAGALESGFTSLVLIPHQCLNTHMWVCGTRTALSFPSVCSHIQAPELQYSVWNALQLFLSWSLCLCSCRQHLDSSSKSQTGCFFLAEIFLDVLIPLGTLCFYNSLTWSLQRYLLTHFLASLTHWIVSPLGAGPVLPRAWPRVRPLGRLCWSTEGRHISSEPRSSPGRVWGFPRVSTLQLMSRLQTKAPNPGLFPRDNTFT